MGIFNKTRRKRFSGLFSVLMCALLFSASNAQDHPYKNPDLSVDERVDNLISLMTLDEKVYQMLCIWNMKDPMLLDENGNVDYEKARKNFPFGLGQVGRPSDSQGGLGPAETVELTNAIQKYFIEQTRLGIPTFFHEEALHGHAAIDGTSFPQPIALASSFDTDMVERVFTLIAKEARLRGAHQVLTPVVDIAREPRWGRVEETYGEDPYLSAQIGLAAVNGFQGDATFQNKDRVAATLKHMAGHGQPENGNNISPANISERTLREIFLYPFKTIVEKGNVQSIMASYNEVNGVPSHANTWMFRDVLRDEWGFKGYIVSDYYALRELNDRPGLFGHGVAETTEDAAYLGIKAGINIELPDMDVFPVLTDLVNKGRLQESELDELIRPMLALKFQFGLFEDPYMDPKAAEEFIGKEAQRSLALEAAEKSMILLQNKGNIAPVSKTDIKSIAVIGPNADRELLGGYSGQPAFNTTVLEGIKQFAGDDIDVNYAEGVKITTTSGWTKDEVELATEADDAKGIAQAVKLAEQSDIIVLAIGGNEQTSREAWAANHMGDRTNLKMVGRQNELIDALAETGKPIYAFVFNGRPLAFTNLLEKAEVVFECWYLGQETGGAVANVLFGETNPSGKLSISIPRSVGHIPSFYNYKPSARRGYLFDDVSPLFEFGFGLSYTSFEYSEPRLSNASITKEASTMVSLTITNTGDYAGEEVVQMYIRDKFSSVTRPVKELKGFKRVMLNPGESKEVTFEITPESLSFYDINMNYTVEPGEFIIMTGSSSDDTNLKLTTLKVTE